MVAYDPKVDPRSPAAITEEEEQELLSHREALELAEDLGSKKVQNLNKVVGALNSKGYAVVEDMLRVEHQQVVDRILTTRLSLEDYRYAQGQIATFGYLLNLRGHAEEAKDHAVQTVRQARAALQELDDPSAG